MSAHEARDYWEDAGLVLLVGSFLLAPLAWLLDLEISYAMVKWACEHERRGVLLLVPLGSLAVIGIATTMAWSCWTKLRAGASQEGARLVDRSYFLALAALAMNAMFALLILVSLAPRYFLSPCE